jgi:hypothetical protein
MKDMPAILFQQLIVCAFWEFLQVVSLAIRQ